MTSKTLIRLAIAGTFGWSAAAFAGSGHEVVTPFSPSESGEVVFMQKHGFSSHHMAGIGSISDQSESTLSMDESLALGDEGTYSDFYVADWTPSETFDYGLDDTLSWGEIAAGEEGYFLSPSYDLAGSSIIDGSVDLGDDASGE